jgi:hypothetical protein
MVGKGFGRIIIKLGRYGGAITNTAEDLGRERSRRDIVCVFGLLSAAEGLFLLCLSEMGRDGMEWVGRDYYMEFDVRLSFGHCKGFERAHRVSTPKVGCPEEDICCYRTALLEEK